MLSQLFEKDLSIVFFCYSVFKEQLLPFELPLARSLKTKQVIKLLNNFLLHIFLLRKEVIHPHVLVGIPCYDLTPITSPTFDGSFLAVRPPASGITSSRGVTGGVYKTRERIHRSIADLRLLAIPAS